MKTISVVLLAVGLASAINVAPPVPHTKRTALHLRQANESAADAQVSAAVLTPEEEAAQEGVVQVDGLDQNAADAVGAVDIGDINLDLASGDQNAAAEILAALSQQGLDSSDLGNLNLIGGIDSLIGGMGLGSFINADIFGSFGFNQQLELFLLLNQLNQLMQFGFVNQFDILALLQQGLILNQFNFGFFKRTVEEWQEVSLSTARC